MLKDIGAFSEIFNAEMVHVSVQQRISTAGFSEMADRVKVSVIEEQALEALTLTLTTWLVGGKIPDLVRTETVEYPDGVWQTFKHKFMPAWFTARFPVRMSKVIIETQRNTYFVCPHQRTPDNRQHIQFMVTGSPLAYRMRER